MTLLLKLIGILAVVWIIYYSLREPAFFYIMLSVGFLILLFIVPILFMQKSKDSGVVPTIFW